MHGYDDSKRSFFCAHYETFHTSQRAAINAYSQAGGEVRPGHQHRTGDYEGPEILNFTVTHRGWDVAHADNLLDARHLQNADAVIQVEAAKEISRKEWLLDNFDAVGPVALDPADRHVGLYAM